MIAYIVYTLGLYVSDFFMKDHKYTWFLQFSWFWIS